MYEQNPIALLFKKCDRTWFSIGAVTVREGKGPRDAGTLGPIASFPLSLGSVLQWDIVDREVDLRHLLIDLEWFSLSRGCM